MSARDGRPDPAFWRGRRVWVTGHAGFKGAWLALWLAELGAEIHGFGHAPDGPDDVFHRAGVAGWMAGSRFGDLRDAEALDAAYADARPEIVLHLAAQALVRRSYDAPLETVASNALGTAAVLERCRRAPDPPQAVVVVTTDKVYRNAGDGDAFSEDAPLGGHDPYSASKAAAEILTESWRASFFEPRGIPLATARAGNVIGGGDFAADRLIPDAIRAFRAGVSLNLRMPQAVRPWQHAIEPLGGYLLLAEALADGRADVRRAFNFGPDPAQFQTVGAVAQRAAALWGDGAAVSIGASDAARPEAARLTLDSAAAAARLGWRPRFGLDDALAMTIAWYGAAAEGADADRLAGIMREQISKWDARA